MNKLNCKNRKQREHICNALQLFSGFLFWFLSFTVVPALADTPQLVQTEQTQNQIVQRLTTQNSLKDRAKMWGLTTKEFKRYLWLMKNTPSGHWYKNLDPAEVLALNAKDPNDMMQYAKIQAHNMHARITRELAFDVIYGKAYKRLYPDEQPIEMPGDATAKGLSHLSPGDHIWWFVNPKGFLGRPVYKKLDQLITQYPNTVLDIYCVGKSVTKSSIQRWAMATHINPNQIDKNVTLNFGNQRFEAIKNKLKKNKINLPLIGVVHHGQFQPISLSSILN